MTQPLKLALCLTAALGLAGTALGAEPERDRPPPREHAPSHEMRPAEPHAGPHGYARVTEPQGWNARPKTVDRSAYQHNFQAARNFHVGPYHRPRGWVARRWGYGDRLPRAYWAAQYVLADYWLFALEVPPTGYEWIRVGDDALLVSTTDGEVLQVEYGVFA